MKATRHDFSTRLTRAAVEIELIESCMGHHLEKDPAKLRSLSKVLAGASKRLQQLVNSDPAYGPDTFLKLAHERLSMMKRERHEKMRAKRLRREEMERERQMFLRDLGRQLHAA